MKGCNAYPHVRSPIVLCRFLEFVANGTFCFSFSLFQSPTQSFLSNINKTLTNVISPFQQQGYKFARNCEILWLILSQENVIECRPRLLQDKKVSFLHSTNNSFQNAILYDIICLLLPLSVYTLQLHNKILFH